MADDPCSIPQPAPDARLVRWAAKMLEQLTEQGREAGGSPEQLMRLSNQAARGEVAMDLLFALAPEAADPDLWVAWLQGEASPRASLRTPQFVEGHANSGRKIKSALRDAEAAETDVETAESRLRKAQQELLAAEDGLQKAEDHAKRQRDLARGAAAWALLNEAARLSSSVFAMGPAWALLRIVSGHLSDVPGWEESENAEVRDLVAKHRTTRPQRSAAMLQALNARSSDPIFEIGLFESIHAFISSYEAGHQPTTSHSMRTLRNGVGRRVKTDNARQVASGVRL